MKSFQSIFTSLSRISSHTGYTAPDSIIVCVPTSNTCTRCGGFFLREAAMAAGSAPRQLPFLSGFPSHPPPLSFDCLASGTRGPPSRPAPAPAPLGRLGDPSRHLDRIPAGFRSEREGKSAPRNGRVAHRPVRHVAEGGVLDGVRRQQALVGGPNRLRSPCRRRIRKPHDGV